MASSLVAVFGPGLLPVVIGVGIGYLPAIARIIRSEALIAARQAVHRRGRGARLLGTANRLPPHRPRTPPSQIIVQASMNLPYAIIDIAGLCSSASASSRRRPTGAGCSPRARADQPRPVAGDLPRRLDVDPRPVLEHLRCPPAPRTRPEATAVDQRRRPARDPCAHRRVRDRRAAAGACSTASRSTCGRRDARRRRRERIGQERARPRPAPARPPTRRVVGGEIVFDGAI